VFPSVITPVEQIFGRRVETVLFEVKIACLFTLYYLTDELVSLYMLLRLHLDGDMT
jgi:hypothetical protein